MRKGHAVSPLTLSLLALAALLALGALPLLAGCKTRLPVGGGVSQKEKPLPPEGVHLIQGRDSVLKPGQPLLIPMAREPFELIFPVEDYDPDNGAFHAVRILATNNPLLIDSFGTGTPVDAFAPFAPGTGMAAERGGYPEMTVTDFGHHYIFWSAQDPEAGRARLLGERNGRHVLSWRVSRVNYRNKSYPIGQIPAKGFTLVIFIDENLNGEADHGEWYVADLRFTEF